MIARQTNDGLRKVCDCGRRTWPKCPHGWHFNFTWQGTIYRFSLDKMLGPKLGREIRLKHEAVTIADELREAIRANRLIEYCAPPAPPPPAAIIATFAEYGSTWFTTATLKRGKNKGKPRHANDRHLLNTLVTLPTTHTNPPLSLGQLPIDVLIEADLEVAFAVLAEGHAWNTVNNYLQVVQNLWRWGRKHGLPVAQWFSPESDLKRTVGNQRHVRLATELRDAQGQLVTLSEEDRLLAIAPARLQALIIAALETCCRQGELLALQWQHLTLVGPTPNKQDRLRIPGRLTKTGAFRELPITPRLRALLEMRRTDPAGQAFGPSAFVFGNEVGEAAEFPKKAWTTTICKAHGITPVWDGGRLDAACRAALDAIHNGDGLTFHDLRHEAGSRLIEKGWKLHAVRDWLGHKDISTTSRYLNISADGLAETMQQMEEPGEYARNKQELADLTAVSRKRTAPKVLIH
jgi:integrase